MERAPLVVGSGFHAFNGLPVHGHWKDNDMISDCFMGDEDTNIVDGAFSLHLKPFSHLLIYTLIESADFNLYFDYDNGKPAFSTFTPVDARLHSGALAVTLDLKPAADSADLCSCLKGSCGSPDCTHNTLDLPGKLDFPSRFVAWSDTNGNHQQDPDEPAVEDSIVGKHCTLGEPPLAPDMVVNLRCSVDFASLTP